MQNQKKMNDFIDKKIQEYVEISSQSEPELLKKLTKEKKLEVSYIIKPEDQYCWQFSNKGYFNFKSNIPKILSHLKLN